MDGRAGDTAMSGDMNLPNNWIPQHPCPTCNRCPTCGNQPSWPVYPVWYGSGPYFSSTNHTHPQMNAGTNLKPGQSDAI